MASAPLPEEPPRLPMRHTDVHIRRPMRFDGGGDGAARIHRSTLTLSIALMIAWYGAWIAIAFAAPAAHPWLSAHRWPLRLGPALLILIVVLLDLARNGVRTRVRHASRRWR